MNHGDGGSIFRFTFSIKNAMAVLVILIVLMVKIRFKIVMAVYLLIALRVMCHCTKSKKEMAVLIILIVLTVIVNFTCVSSPYYIWLAARLDYYANGEYVLTEYDPLLFEQQCTVSEWQNNSITVYDCSTPASSSTHNQLKIGIVSFHSYKSTDFVRFVTSNHVAYALQHNYVYFQAHNVIFNNSETHQYYTSLPVRNERYYTNPIYKIQKPFILSVILSEWRNSDHMALDYVLWIDFDAIFYNCSISIPSVIQTAHQIYKGRLYGDDLIFSRDWYTLANSGVVIWKNTEWSNDFLTKMKYMVENAHKELLDYDINGWFDQHIFNTLLLGYGHENRWNRNDHDKHAHKRFIRDAVKEQEHATKWHHGEYLLVNPEYNIYVHEEYLDDEIQRHTAMLPERYINLMLRHWIRTNYYHRHKLDGDPYILHFAGDKTMKQFMKSPLFDFECKASISE
mmetsp:Transcript_72554/g.115776  ORF Transcript_72554/g.115776 Transcript_72554/m.115776 type:complete len:453 (-) Transcript_72554:63-1421(-)